MSFEDFEHAQAHSVGNSLQKDEHKRLSFSRRALVAGVLVVTSFLLLLARMFHLQIRQYDYYRTRAVNNLVRIRALTPQRGKIYDRNGKILSENMMVFQVEVSPSHVKDIEQALRIYAEVIPLKDDEKQEFLKRYRSTRQYDTVILKSLLSAQERYRLEVQLHRLPGFEITPYDYRYYPHGALTAHIIGYTGAINREDMARINPLDYRGMNYIGRTGIEQQYEERLRGSVGYQQVEADANGRIVRILKEQATTRGQDLYLSLDLNLQRSIDHIFGNLRGAAVAIEPESGEVLAMVSKPSFDSNLFTHGIAPDVYRWLLNDPHYPLFNRAIKGRYAPGSVIKPLMNLAGFHYGLVEKKTRIRCNGYYTIPDSKTERRFHCWNRGGHGWMDSEHAMGQSCDVFYYTIGYQLGINTMSSFMQEFNIGVLCGIDLPEESSGLMPTRAWKQEQFNQPWYIGDTINVSIGQGFMITTPLQMAYFTALIAMRGRSHPPHFLCRAYHPDRDAMEVIDYPLHDNHLNIKEEYWQEVQQEMINVVHSKFGTARALAQGLSYTMAAKTGTVQVVSFRGNQRIKPEDLPEDQRDNSVFIAYAPAEQPRIALSILLERSGGIVNAGELARKIMDAYLLDEERV